MAKNFKEAADEFQKLTVEYNNKLMRDYNNTLVIKNGQSLQDSDEVKCQGNKGFSGYTKDLEKIAKEIITNVELKQKETKNEDNITSPNHYVTDKGFEVFDVQEAFIHELKGMAASYWCNIVKYILRFQRKNGVEDLKKARYYLDKLIEEEEND